MQRKLDVLLWEARKQADLIRQLTTGKDFPDYCNDQVIRLAVERVFIILGEVLVRLSTSLPADYRRLMDAALVINFRNQLVHEYDIMSDAEVWKIVTQVLPKLSEKATEMLNEQQP